MIIIKVCCFAAVALVLGISALGINTWQFWAVLILVAVYGNIGWED